MNGRVPHGHWSRERIIDAIQEFNRIYERPPTARDWNVSMARNQGRPDLVERFYEDGCWPHTSNIYGSNRGWSRPFSSWNEALTAAGITPRKTGGRGATSEYAREHFPPRKPKTHCKHGHEFTPENTYVTGKQRVCKTCDRAARRRYRLRRRESA